jgi:hypothetical protein
MRASFPLRGDDRIRCGTPDRDNRDAYGMTDEELRLFTGFGEEQRYLDGRVVLEA